MGRPYDLAIIGGGPAGSAAAITTARAGRRVLLMEAGRYPRHKVCGEFVSAEALNPLRDLLGPRFAGFAGQPPISRVRLFLDGAIMEMGLNPPALSLPRIQLDAALWEAAAEAGADTRSNVTTHSIQRSTESSLFLVQAGEKTFESTAVVDASGRHSRLHPASLGQRTAIGLKAHAFAESAPGTLDMYFFRGGYCGVQPVSHEQINVCALVSPRVASSLPELFEQCPRLHARSRDWQFCMKPIVTAGLAPGLRLVEDNGILRAGDAAGFIDPFAGDGISLAVRSGILAGELAATPHRYAPAYRAQFARGFQTAAAARWVLQAPASLRQALFFALGSARVLEWTVQNTRKIA
jgi:flavin-dependent dehydrogenase